MNYYTLTPNILEDENSATFSSAITPQNVISSPESVEQNGQLDSPDLDDHEVEVEREDDDDDDPNWFMSSLNHSKVAEDVVVVRRPKEGLQGKAASEKRRSSLGKFLEGVNSYWSGNNGNSSDSKDCKDEEEDEEQIASRLRDENFDRELHKTVEPRQSSMHNIRRLHSLPAGRAMASECPELSSPKLDITIPGYDPIAARICELFDEMQPLELKEDEDFFASDLALNTSASRKRNVMSRGKKNSVSGYFSEWTKWLRSGEKRPNTNG